MESNARCFFVAHLDTFTPFVFRPRRPEGPTTKTKTPAVGCVATFRAEKPTKIYVATTTTSRPLAAPQRQKKPREMVAVVRNE